jgi:hypothetical protein
MKRFLPCLGMCFLAGTLSLAAVVSDKTSAKATPPQPAAKTADKVGVIEGVAIPRGNGTWLGIKVDAGNFILGFYDKKKKPMTPDAARATARWKPAAKTGSMLCVMNPGGDGKHLIGNKPVTPPFNFKLYLTLLSADGGTMDSHVVDFVQ